MVGPSESVFSKRPASSVFPLEKESKKHLSLPIVQESYIPNLIMPGHDRENLRYITAFERLGSQVQVADWDMDVDMKNLSKELHEIMESHDCSLEKSLPQEIVERALEKKIGTEAFVYPELAKIEQLANQLVETSDGVLLPGGTSIHPSFYGEEDPVGEKRGFYDSNPKRTLLEIFLIHACQNQNKPLMGICRGHQLINVYFGGTLDREAVGEFQLAKVRKVDLSHEKEEDSKWLPDAVYFNHRQSVAKLGTGLQPMGKILSLESLEEELKRLEKTLEEAKATLSSDRTFYEEIGAPEIYDDADAMVKDEISQKERMQKVLKYLQDSLVVAIKTERGPPIIGVQFHPEMVFEDISLVKEANVSANENLMSSFLDLVKEMKETSRVFSKVKGSLSP